MNKQETANDILHRLDNHHLQVELGAHLLRAFTDSRGWSGLRFDLVNLPEKVNHALITHVPVENSELHFYNIEYSCRNGDQYKILWNLEGISPNMLRETFESYLEYLNK